MRWNTEADAIAAADEAGKLGQFDNSSPPVWNWNRDHVAPDIKAWRMSQDNADGTHNYLAGWFCIVSTQGVNQTLLNRAELQFALNRDGPPWIVKTNIAYAVMRDIGAEPLFAGTDYSAIHGNAVKVRFDGGGNLSAQGVKG